MATNPQNVFKHCLRCGNAMVFEREIVTFEKLKANDSDMEFAFCPFSEY